MRRQKTNANQEAVSLNNGAGPVADALSIACCGHTRGKGRRTHFARDDMPKVETINIIIDGNKRTVSRADYARAKLKTLREFGYTSLKLTEVEDQLAAALAGKQIGAGLNVIGGFIKSDLDEKQ